MAHLAGGNEPEPVGLYAEQVSAAVNLDSALDRR